jgi:hypothetical protein
LSKEVFDVKNGPDKLKMNLLRFAHVRPQTRWNLLGTAAAKRTSIRRDNNDELVD